MKKCFAETNQSNVVVNLMLTDITGNYGNSQRVHIGVCKSGIHERYLCFMAAILTSWDYSFLRKQNSGRNCSSGINTPDFTEHN